jgi:hypothetical protein
MCQPAIYQIGLAGSLLLDKQRSKEKAQMEFLPKEEDIIPQMLMVAAAHTPCQGGRIVVVEKGPQLSRPKEDSAQKMGNVRWSIEHSGDT